jgi:hypothetical protein
MNHQQHIDNLEVRIDARRSDSPSISEMEEIKKQIRIDEMRAKSGAPKPRYRVPARKREMH